MTLKKLALAGILLAPLFAAAPAEAREYCREYQKTIRVGNNYESGYGTACMQPDGAWIIVESRGTVDPFDDLRRERDVIIVSDQRPVYYSYGPSYRPVTYYPRKHHHYGRDYFYSRPGITFSFYDNDRWDRRRHWDRDDWKRKRGHGHHHHRGHGRGHDRDDD